MSIAFVMFIHMISNTTAYMTDFDRASLGSRFCQTQYGSGEAEATASSVTDGKWDDAENIARRRAQVKACKEANELGKKNVTSCPEGCYPRFFMRDNCDFEDQSLEAGEGESDDWFRACQLERADSDFCKQYQSHYHQWAILKTRAEAKVELICLKK